MADGLIARGTPDRLGQGGRKSGANAGVGLALGSFLDGVPEQLVLGVGLAGGKPVSVALLVAIFVSNLPEGIGSATDMSAAGTARSKILAAVPGHWARLHAARPSSAIAIADSISGEVQGAVNGFAAGALLVMLIDSMIPEAREKGGRTRRPGHRSRIRL